MTSEIDIRPLREEDVAAYRALRLDALHSSPTSFGSSVEDEIAMSEIEVRQQALPAPPGLSLGAFEGATLRGISAYVPERRRKLRHKATMVAVYVAPALRGTGTGRRLVEAIVEHARTQRTILHCRVMTENAAARGLYHRLGFVPYGIDRNALLIDGVYLDEELLALDLRHP